MSVIWATLLVIGFPARASKRSISADTDSIICTEISDFLPGIGSIKFDL